MILFIVVILVSLFVKSYNGYPSHSSYNYYNRDKKLSLFRNKGGLESTYHEKQLTPARGLDDTTCQPNEFLLTVEIKTDYYPSDTSWKLTVLSNNEEVWAGGPYETAANVYEHNKCFVDGSY